MIGVYLLLLLGTTPNNIVVDGILHRNQMKAYYTNSFRVDDTEAADTTHLSIDSVFVQWDTVALYFRIKSDDTLWLGTSGDIFVAIDTYTPGGGTFSPVNKHVRFSGNLPEYVYYIYDNGNNQLYSWNGSGWDLVYTDSNSGGAGLYPDFEVSLPLSEIGNPDSINLTVYTTPYKTGNGYPDYTKDDTAFYPVIIDGVKDEGYMELDTSDQSGGTGADLDSLYVLWDSVNLYIFIVTRNTASWDVAYGVGLDVDQIAGSGYYTGSSDAWGRKINFGNTASATPYAIDYEIYFWWSGTDGSITSAYMYKWNGAGWDDITPLNTWYSFTGDNTTGLQTLEISIPWSSIGGVHPEIHMSAWITGGNLSSAVDIIPHDDQISNNADEWTDDDTVFTYSVFIPDGDQAEDAISSIVRGDEYAPSTVYMNNSSINLKEYGITFGYYDFSNWGNTPMGFLDPMDGLIDNTGFEEDEMLVGMSTKNGWITWDSDSLYIGYTYQAFDAGEGGEGDFFVYMEVDSSSGPDDPNDPGTRIAIDWWGGDTIILPLKMDYAIAVEDGGYYALYKYVDTTASWEELYSNVAGNFPGSAYIGWDNGGGGNGVTEISLAWSAIGSPVYFAFVMFCHTEDSSNIFGVTPAANDSYFNNLNTTIPNNDGVTDTLENCWGIYYLPSGSIAPNDYLSNFLTPTDVGESHSYPRGQEGNFEVYYDVRGDVITVRAGSAERIVILYDITGRAVRKWKMTGEKKYRLSNLPCGVYFVRCEGENKSYKFVKIR